MAAKKQNWLFPALVVAGVAAWYFFGKKKETQAVPNSESSLDQYQTPPIVANNAEVTALQSAVAVSDRAALVNYDPKNEVLYKQMNDAETITAYNYFFGYLTLGKRLYPTPGATGIYSDGGYDPALYDAVMKLRAKYGIYV